MTDAVNYERLLARVDSIVERQSDLTGKQTELTAKLDHLANTLPAQFVPRELYVSQREADRQDVADVVRRVDTSDQNRAADRRLIFAALLGPFLVGLLLLYVAAQVGGSPT